MNNKPPPANTPNDVDESSQESFPASDPPAFNPGTAGGPRRSADKKRPATTEQLRDDIDKGRTGDKVAAPDPAAAPLGTDDEAAGTPPDPEELARLRERERR